MRKVRIASLLLVLLSVGGTLHAKDKGKQYKSTWESLAQEKDAPDWLKDAKFGIYTHYGPTSGAFVNMEPGQYLAGWHGMIMYENKGMVNWKTGKVEPNKNGVINTKPSANYIHHIKQFGDPKEFGYKYLIEQFDPSAFDAKEWADLFQASGAKFAGPVAMHHDNFAMWDAKSTRWNSMNYGDTDFSAELKKEIESRDMKYMASFHHAFTWKYFAPAHEYGGIDPKDYDLYTNPHAFASSTPDKEFMESWWAKLKEYIDVYEPDALWFDWWLENLDEDYRKKFLSYYYNKGLEWNKEVGVFFKETTFPEKTAIRDYERGRPNQPKDRTWITDTSPGTWFYRSNAKFVSPNKLIDILVDIVSKNGLMLLNVPPDPDGSIPQEMKTLLTDMGDWLQVNGDAIYGTRPWAIFGEGPTRLAAGGHKVEGKSISYKSNDIRFTKKSDSELYAIIMDTPTQDIQISSLSSNIGALNRNIEKIELLGSDEELKWKRNESGLIITLPKSFPTEYAHAFHIICEGYKENKIGGEIE